VEIKKTSLNNLHQAYQAKFVEFAGYQMPIQYKEGIIEEHKFTRQQSGIFDVSHMGQLFIYGKENLAKDLEKIFPLNLKNLKLNHSKYSFLMNEEAGIYDDLIITKIEDGFLIILNAACKENDFKILSEILKNKYKMVLDEKRSLIAIQGPKSAGILNQIIDNVITLTFMSGGWFKYENQKTYITRSGYTGEDGFEVSVNNELAEKFTKELIKKGAKLIGLGARDTLRLEAGLCLYGHELDIEKTPVESNLKWAMSKERVSNGGFIGSKIISEQLTSGIKKIRVGIKPDGKIIAREKTKIFNDTEALIGEVTSGTFGPSVNGPIAMGYVEDKFSKKNTKVYLEIRGKKYPANICGLPFYKKSYVKGAIK
jgi:aminomethyltransferase